MRKGLSNGKIPSQTLRRILLKTGFRKISAVGRQAFKNRRPDSRFHRLARPQKSATTLHGPSEHGSRIFPSEATPNLPVKPNWTY